LQQGYVEKIATIERDFTKQNITELTSELGRITGERKDQIQKVEKDMDIRINKINDELSRRTEIFVTHNELRRVDDLIAVVRDQLRVIETTRPTTGELQSASTSANLQIAEVKLRLQSLEDYLRTARPQGALAPVGQALTLGPAYSVNPPPITTPPAH